MKHYCLEGVVHIELCDCKCRSCCSIREKFNDRVEAPITPLDDLGSIHRRAHINGCICYQCYNYFKPVRVQRVNIGLYDIPANPTIHPLPRMQDDLMSWGFVDHKKHLIDVELHKRSFTCLILDLLVNFISDTWYMCTGKSLGRR